MTNLQLISEKVEGNLLSTENLGLYVTPGFFKRLAVALTAIAEVSSVVLKKASLSFTIDSRSAVFVQRGFYKTLSATGSVDVDVIKGTEKSILDELPIDSFAADADAVFFLETLSLEDAAYKWVGGRPAQDSGATGREGQGQGASGKTFGSVGADGVTINRVGFTAQSRASAGSSGESDKDSGTGSDSDKDSGTSSSHLKP